VRSWGTIAIVDTGPLYATVDEEDQDHARSLEVLRRPDLRLIIPTLVVTEVIYLIGSRLGAEVEVGFLAGLEEFVVEAPLPGEWVRIADLVRRYGGFPLGGVDASVIALAERFGADTIITLDQRHFRAVRPRHVAAFRLLPEDF
jgi:predicted nucleic acid-binding protein